MLVHYMHYELLGCDEEVTLGLGCGRRKGKGPFPQREQGVKMHDLVKDSKHPG